MRARAIVVGGGLSGLAAGLALARAGLDVRILEASESAGGVAGSVRRGAFLFERGPSTVLAGARAFRELTAELGLSERLVRASPAARARWILHRGALHEVPASPFALLASDLVSWRGKLALFGEPLRRFVPPPLDSSEPTLGAFFDERLGREFARLFAAAFVRGVWAAELDELGAQSAFPRAWELAARHGGLARGFYATRRERALALPGPKFPRNAPISFPGGLQELVDALARALGDALETGSRAFALERIGARWIVRTHNDVLVADAVVLAVNAREAARLLAPLGIDAGALSRMRSARLTTVGLGWESGRAPALPPGFGYLTAPDPAAPILASSNDAPASALGTIFTSNLFPERAARGGGNITSFYRGEDVEGLDDAALAARARAELALALHAPAIALHAPAIADADVVHVERWSEALPRYAPGHAAQVGRLVRELRFAAPGIAVAGNWVAGASVEQVIAAGRAAALAVSRELERRAAEEAA